MVRVKINKENGEGFTKIKEGKEKGDNQERRKGTV